MKRRSKKQVGEQVGLVLGRAARGAARASSACSSADARARRRSRGGTRPRARPMSWLGRITQRAHAAEADAALLAHRDVDALEEVVAVDLACRARSSR